MNCSAAFHTTADIATYVACVVNKYFIPFLVLVAVGAFIYHLVVYIHESSNEKRRTAAYYYMMWSLGALAVIITIWGIVSAVLASVGINSIIPQFPTK